MESRRGWFRSALYFFAQAEEAFNTNNLILFLSLVFYGLNSTLDFYSVYNKLRSDFLERVCENDIYNLLY